MTFVIRILNEYWGVVCSLCAIISAIVVFYINLLSVRKLRLEIEKLKESKKDEKRRIIQATMDEIEKYGIERDDGAGVGCAPQTSLGHPYLFLPPIYWIPILLGSAILTGLLFAISTSSIVKFAFGITFFIWIYFFLTTSLFRQFIKPGLENMMRVLEHQ
jgi:hypothetical protein